MLGSSIELKISLGLEDLVLQLLLFEGFGGSVSFTRLLQSLLLHRLEPLHFKLHFFVLLLHLFSLFFFFEGFHKLLFLIKHLSGPLRLLSPHFLDPFLLGLLIMNLEECLFFLLGANGLAIRSVAHCT